MKVMAEEVGESSREYLTPGKVYEAKNVDSQKMFFEMIDDQGDLIHCVVEGCPHLSIDQSLNWTIVEE